MESTTLIGSDNTDLLDLSGGDLGEGGNTRGISKVAPRPIGAGKVFHLRSYHLPPEAVHPCKQLARQL